MFMKTLVLAIALLIGRFPLLGSTNPAAQQLLVTAKQQASLFHDPASPFQLDVDFIAQINVPAQGHLTLKWQAKDRWWRRIVMGNFEQIDVRNGDRLFTNRNLNFAPVRIGELVSLLQFAEDAQAVTAKKQKERSENGIMMTCLKVEGANRGKGHEVCLNSASHDILSDAWQEPPDEKREEQYSDYFDFGEHRYPRKLQLLVNGIKVLTANVANLTSSHFDETLVVAPKGAIERRQCVDMKHAMAVKTPDPRYPTSARDNRLTGDTTVAMTVLTDGSVTDIRVIGSAARSMDDATLQTLKMWKFKPAMCGAEPVVSDIEVVVSFRLY
jgi:TonB family protein